MFETKSVIILSLQQWIINTSEVPHKKISVSVLFHFVRIHDFHKTFVFLCANLLANLVRGMSYALTRCFLLYESLRPKKMRIFVWHLSEKNLCCLSAKPSIKFFGNLFLSCSASPRLDVFSCLELIFRVSIFACFDHNP